MDARSVRAHFGRAFTIIYAVIYNTVSANDAVEFCRAICWWRCGAVRRGLKRVPRIDLDHIIQCAFLSTCAGNVLLPGETKKKYCAIMQVGAHFSGIVLAFTVLLKNTILLRILILPLCNSCVCFLVIRTGTVYTLIRKYWDSVITYILLVLYCLYPNKEMMGLILS